MLNLSDRLSVIAGCVSPGESVADIGTDHGLLPIFLWQRGIVSKIILSDINEGPLEKAKNNINMYAPDMIYSIRMDDGLKAIDSGEVDTVIIAGMGGLLMTRILEADTAKTLSFRKYILQPRSAQDKLRKWLFSRGFEIIDEHLVREGKYICEIIAAKPPDSDSVKTDNKIQTESELIDLKSDLQFEISPVLFSKQDPLLAEFIKQKIKKEEKVIPEILRHGSEKSKKKAVDAMDRLEELYSLLSRVTVDLPK